MTHVPVPLRLRPDAHGRMVELDRYARVQDGYMMHHAYPPRPDGSCACGCGRQIEGRRTRWATSECSRLAHIEWAIVCGRTGTIRAEVFKRDGGQCYRCGKVRPWEAHHLVAVAEGGGACGLDNFATICRPCHEEETAALTRRLRAPADPAQLLMEGA